MKGKLIAFLLPVVYVFALLLVVSPSSVYAHDGDKIRICHSTSSHSNPYTSNNVDKNATVAGHDLHNGDIWYSGIKGNWGDIIPPYSYTVNEVVGTHKECPTSNSAYGRWEYGKTCQKTFGRDTKFAYPVDVDVYGDVTHQYAGKNWTLQGQAIWNNNCNIPYVQCSKTALVPWSYGLWSNWSIDSEDESLLSRVRTITPVDFYNYFVTCPSYQDKETQERELCTWETATYADEETCVEPEYCALDDSLLADDPNCVACEWNPEILAGNEACVEPEYCPWDESLLASDSACVVCEWDETLLAGDALCVEPVDDEGEVKGTTDEAEVKGTTDVVLADTGASDSTLVYLIEGILVLGTLVSSTMFIKKYAI